MIVFFVLAFMTPNTAVFSQNLKPNRDNVIMPDSIKGPIDTLSSNKKRKPRKPFASYMFADSLKKAYLYKWNINLKDATVRMKPIDTMAMDFQKDALFLKNNPTGSAYVGILGGAATPLKYTSRANDYSNSFTNPYADYFYKPENVDFYNGKVPFTQFEYITSGQRQYAQEHLLINHAQNISPATSMDLTYRNNRKRGQYANQQSRNKNLSINLAHTGQRYTVFMGYINNIAMIDENGGVKNPSDIIDTTYDYQPNIPVNLKANNTIRGNQFYLTQSYAFPLKSTKIDSATNFSQIPHLAIGMSLNYSSYRKIYSDNKSETGNYYENWYYNNAQTRDSIHERNTDLTFFARYQPYNKYGAIGNITAGAGYNHEMYYNFSANEYLSPFHKDIKNSLYVYGAIDGGYYQYLRWGADVKYYPIGYRNQDLELGGNVSLLFGKKHNPITIALNAKISTLTPSYWTQHFESNHYRWHNNFDKEFKMRYEFSFRMDKINLEIGLSEVMETDKVYYDANSLPAQFDGSVNVLGAYLRKDFVWKRFHFNHRLDFQHSSNQEVIPVPMFSLNANYFYDINVVRNVLNIHFGIDAYYNTKYYGFGYNPAIGQFYNQRDYKLGNYPWFDVFAVGKWKRLRFILKLQHISFGMLEKGNYMYVANYPTDRMMFTFGFSWSFYD